MPATTASARPATLTRAVLVVLTLAGVLLCVLGTHSAAHSAMAGHAEASGHSSSAREDPSEQGSVARTGDQHSSAMAACEDDCAMPTAMTAATCSVVLVLASLFLLAGLPSVVSHGLQAAPRLVRLRPDARFHVYQPSLTVLSISRT